MKELCDKELQAIKLSIETELRCFRNYYINNLDKRDILIKLIQKILVEQQRRGLI